jgi:tRNA (guanine10-N2)-dimethyltransferase
MIRAEPELAIRAARRCSLLKSLNREIAHLPISPNDALPAIEDLAVEMKSIPPGGSFMVRALRLYGAGKSSDVPLWEVMLGKALHIRTGSKVDVRSPDRIFNLLVNPQGSLLGESLWNSTKGRFSNRSPQRRPFTHPSNLTPKLAVCMLNLARVKVGQVVLDPFCGAGSILMECEHMGGHSLGVDIARRMVRGSGRNLKWIGGAQLGLIQGDARCLPIREVDAIVTDPPYGLLSSTHGERPERLYSSLLTTSSEILRSGSHLVALSPLTMGIDEMAEKAGLDPVESYPIYVNKHMIREVGVFRRR